MNAYSFRKKRFGIFHVIVKIVFLVTLLVGFPYLVVRVGLGYKQKAITVIEKERAEVVQLQAGDYAEGIKVLTREEVETLDKIRNFIGGEWYSEHDGRYKIVIDLNNQFREYYDDIEEGFGSWKVFSSMPQDVTLSEDSVYVSDTHITASSTEYISDPEYSAYTTEQYNSTKPEPKYFFQKEQREEKYKGLTYVYQIQQLDTDVFILVYKNGSGKQLRFVRNKPVL